MRLEIAVVAILSTAGCYSTWDVAPRELTHLKGFERPQEVELEDVEGSSFRFDGSTELSFDRADGTSPERHRFSSIDEVKGHTLQGLDDEHRSTLVELTHVERIEAKNFSVGKTVALSLGVTMGAATLAGIALAVVYANGFNDSGFGSSWSFGSGFALREPRASSSIAFASASPRGAGR